jgi:hypothetical protein
VSSLVTLPLRLGLRVAGIVLHPVVKVAEQVFGGSQNGAPPEREAPPQAVPAPRRTPAPPPAPPRAEPESRADEPPEPVHVSEEPVVVAEVADQGAEEGAGAQVTVAEPWEGYSRMKAADVIDRLAVATPEEIAVVQLYERTHRRRKTVVEAAAYSQRK